MALVIQLGLDTQDDKLFWVDEFLWDDDSVDNVKRPTEILAFRQLFRQARLIRKRGMLIHLSTLQREALRMEYHAMRTVPMPDNIHNWIAGRMRGLTPLQVKALLDECSFVVLLRDVLGMPPLVIEWGVEPSVVKRVA